MEEQIQGDQLTVRESARAAGSREWHLSNRSHDLAARFDGAGLNLSSQREGQDGWRFRMEFAGYGHGTASYCAPVTEVIVVGNRVEYRRGPVTEWWRNQPTGLEHGFTLHEPPKSAASAGPMRLALALQDGLRAQATEGKAQAVQLADANGAVVRYGGLKVWDATGRTLPAWMEVTAAGQQVDIVIRDEEARYPVEVDPTFTLVRKVTPSDGAAGDNFGNSVSVSGDVAVVGVPYDDVGAGRAQGSVYVFERNTGGTNNWGQVKRLTASDGASRDSFGSSVSVSGNVIVVGAAGDDEGPTVNQGSVYVFERNAGGANNWGQTQKLLDIEGAQNGSFGASVSVSGETVAAGAPHYGELGSAYLFGLPGVYSPQILQQPQGATNLVGSTTSFGVIAIIGPPLGYQWHKDGLVLTNGGRISGATSSNLVIATVQPTDSGAYRVVVSNSGGSVTSKVAMLEVIDLGSGVEATNLIWSSGGNALWFAQSAVTHDDVDSVRSGAILSGEESWMQTTVTGPSTLAFWWKVSSEMDYDTLDFSIDGVVRQSLSGEEDWQQPFFAVAEGSHTLRWRFVKDFSTALGQDAAWVDEVRFEPDSGPPVVLAQPVSRLAGLADTVAFVAGVGGGKPRSYQWFKNENPIADATNTTLVLTNIQLADAGSYHLNVTNASGDASSSNALLSVTRLGAIETILLFAEQPNSSPYRVALTNLGLAHQLFTDPVAFNTAVANANPATTLVVVGPLFPSLSLNPVGRFANAGGRVVMQYWGLIPTSTLAAAFNASVVQQVRFAPEPIYNWGGSSLFAGLSSPIFMSDLYTFSGQLLQTTAGGQAVAGFVTSPTANQGAIVIGHSGRTILNGFNMEDVTVVNNAVRLAQNEIQLVSDPTMLVPPSLVAPVPPLNLGGVPGESITLGVEVGGALPMYCRWRVFRSSGGNQVLTNLTLTERLSFITFTVAANSAGAYVVHLTNSIGGSLSQSHTNAVLALLADTDADGLPDVWEAAYATAADPALDSDNDGLTNLEEYRGGTDPTNAASVLRIHRITAGNSATIEFEAISNKTYTVQRTDRVGGGSWSKLLDVVARANNRTETATDSGAGTNRFYRLVTPRQP